MNRSLEGIQEGGEDRRRSEARVVKRARVEIWFSDNAAVSEERTETLKDQEKPQTHPR